LVQEEIGHNTRDGSSSKGEDEEIFALVGKENKGKGKKSQTKQESIQGAEKKYLSKIKWFNFHEFRHYATKCLKKSSCKKNLGGATCEELASQFELDITLNTCMASTMMGTVWHLESGASFHMTGCREFFSDV